MSWTAHQRRMLAEMGLPPWLAPAAPVSARATNELATALTEVRPAPSGPGAAHLVDTPAGQPARERAAETSTVPPAGTARTASTSASPAPVVARATPPVEPTAALDGLDWSSLRAAVEACTACGLCQGRTQTVFGVGHAEADWMIVGEAPGEQEDRLGEPFVGRSGQLLDNMLRALGLGRAEGPPAQQVYIANTIKCRPPGNRNPTPDELARCEPYLVRQIALVRPRIILAMGKFAVQSLLRSSEPIGRLRGQVHHYQGVPLIVTYHPAYLLRNPVDKARAWDDLCLAAETAAATIPADPR
jgi:uracil-DNA glycosylase